MEKNTMSAGDYLSSKLYPQAAALQVALEAIAPGMYTVEPTDSVDKRGERLYNIVAAECRASDLTYSQALCWIGATANCMRPRR